MDDVQQTHTSTISTHLRCLFCIHGQGEIPHTEVPRRAGVLSILTPLSRGGKVGGARHACLTAACQQLWTRQPEAARGYRGK